MYFVCTNATSYKVTQLQSRIQKLKPLDGHPIRNTAEDVNILIKDIGHAVAAPFEKNSYK